MHDHTISMHVARALMRSLYMYLYKQVQYSGST